MILMIALAALVLSGCASGGTLVNNWPGLAADAERAYLSSGSFIYSVDLKTGREIWRYPEQANNKLLFFANPVLAPDGQLLIGSEGSQHDFLSLDPETGRENWGAPFTGAKGPWVAPPLVVDEKIYAPNTDGFIYILDMNGQPAGDPIEIGGVLWSTPATDGTLLYVTSLNHQLLVVNPQERTISTPIDLGGAAPSSPLVTGEGAFVGSFASNIRFVRPNGGSEVIVEAEDWIWGTPVLEGETLYYADLAGNIYSFDLTSGRQNWSAIKPDGSVVARLLIVDDQIYVAAEAGAVLALDRDAKIVWEKVVDGRLYTTPVASNDLILVAPYQAEYAIAAYDADGKQAWTFKPEK
jgi:outer membrane protein assembly factor BamB